MINGHMDEQDCRAIYDAVHSFRRGAPILLDDIRFACRVDGHPIDHINAYYLALYLRGFCIPTTDTRAHRATWSWF